MARLIRTEKEVEGRFEEVWLVVEEDPLTQWPDGPLTVVGRDAVRQDARERVRGEARYTADIQLPGMLHTAVLRSPHAHARVQTIDLAPALALPGVRGALGPGEAKGLEEEAGLLRRRRSRRSRPTRSSRRARALEAIDVEWELLEAVLDPEEAVAREQFTTPIRRRTSAATSSRRSPRPTSSSRARTARRSCCTTRWRRTSRCASGSATRSTSTSRRSTSGASATRVAEELGIPGDKVRVVCEYMGGGFGSKNDPGEYTFVAAELAKRTGRPGAVRADAPRGEHGRGQPQRDDPEADGRRAQRRHDRRARRRVHQRASAGRAGRR